MSKIYLPTVEVDGNFTTMQVDGGGSTTQLFFSFKTLIAFRKDGKEVVRENSWGASTGTHINRVDGGGTQSKKLRLNTAAFEKAYAKAFPVRKPRPKPVVEIDRD